MSEFIRNYWPTKEWLSADPKSLGIKTDILSGLDTMFRTQYKKLNGIVVIRKGCIVYEKYYKGHGPENTQHLASVTKSVISALIGICIDQGYLESVNQNVLDFFPEYKSSTIDIKKRSVTIRHILNMTAPFAFSWKSIDSRPFEPLDRLRRQRDWAKFILDLMGTKSQSGEFQYSTPGAHLLSVVITRVTGKSAREFANEHLFQPIGMQIIPDQEMKSFRLEDVFGDKLNGWIKDPQGNNTGGWGLCLSVRDMARFGFLYLNGGLWDNRQIISEEWIKTSIASNPNHYGYLWWLSEENSTRSFSALGYGGNRISCYPEKDLVVAASAGMANQSLEAWQFIEKNILQAVLDD